MTRYQKILTASVIALVILNAVLIVFIWTNRPVRHELRNHREHRPEIRGRILQEKLNLTTEQKQVFRNALKEHHQQMQNQRRSIRDLKGRINRAIITSDSATLRQANAQLFEIQREMELASQKFTRFMSDLCNEEQRRKLLDVYQSALEWRNERE